MTRYEQLVKDVYAVAERYRAEFDALEGTDRLPDAVRETLRTIPGQSVPRYCLIGIYPFDNGRHWGTPIEAAGELKELHLTELLDYAHVLKIRRERGDTIMAYAEGIEALLPHADAITALRDAYDTAHETIRRTESIEGMMNYHDEVGRKFLHAQMKYEHRELLRAVVERLKILAIRLK